MELNCSNFGHNKFFEEPGHGAELQIIPTTKHDNVRLQKTYSCLSL